MKSWDRDGLEAPVRGVPDGCRAVVLIDLVERNGERVEVRDRRQRQKTTSVVLVADPSHPAPAVDDALRRFALGTGRRRWSTVVSRYGDEALVFALRLVRAGLVDLACSVDARGTVSTPLWWRPTSEALAEASAERSLERSHAVEANEAMEALVRELTTSFPEVATALANARSMTAISLVTAAGEDLLAGIEHAGPRAFCQTHFGRTKAHDVVGVLSSAGLPGDILERLGLRRGDRIGLGGPFVIETDTGVVDLSPLRGPVVLRLDQSSLRVSTSASLVVVLENLQPAEVVCARHPQLAVVYTGGQFGIDTSEILGQVTVGRRAVVIADADLGGVRIARRVVEAVPAAEIIDVGRWAHPEREPFQVDGVSIKGLRRLIHDASVGPLAQAVLDRGYPVEQEAATLRIVDALVAGANELLDS